MADTPHIVQAIKTTQCGLNIFQHACFPPFFTRPLTSFLLYSMASPPCLPCFALFAKKCKVKSFNNHILTSARTDKLRKHNSVFSSGNLAFTGDESFSRPRNLPLLRGSGSFMSGIWARRVPSVSPGADLWQSRLTAAIRSGSTCAPRSPAL